jgi:hypothetical protein
MIFVEQTKASINQLVDDVVKNVEEVYEGIDRLNGLLYDLLEEIGREHEMYDEINDFYVGLPVYHTMDNIIEVVKGLKTKGK